MGISEHACPLQRPHLRMLPRLCLLLLVLLLVLLLCLLLLVLLLLLLLLWQLLRLLVRYRAEGASVWGGCGRGVGVIQWQGILLSQTVVVVIVENVLGVVLEGVSCTGADGAWLGGKVG